MWFMRRLYTEKWKGKRTTITIDPKLKKKIEELLKDGESFGEFVRDAISQDIWHKESTKLGELTSTAQYHKIKQLEHDVEELKKDHVTAKELDSLELETIRIENHVDEIHKKLLVAVFEKIDTYKEAIALLKTAQNNPIIRKELEKL